LADPRLAALGLDFAAAEAEAAEAIDEDDEIPTFDQAALAARLSGLGETPPEPVAETIGATTATDVVVVGLVSVASIASFKRQLARHAGVQSVGVSSGPDGEFVFSVAHDQAIAMKDVVPALPTFKARVTDFGVGVVNVTAVDPETEA
jgi:hypothetical protein